MRKEQLQKKVELVVGYLREEQDLRDRLLSLDLTPGPEQDVERAHKKQADLIAAIERLRFEKVLPIVREVAEFIATRER